MKKRKILLIDDDIMFQAIVISLLSDEYSILPSQSGIDALEILANHVPDLILLDIILPGIDGWEIFHRIKGIAILHDVPIVFISTMSKEEGLEHAKQVGAMGYIVKPINKVDITNAIEKVLAGEKLF